MTISTTCLLPYRDKKFIYVETGTEYGHSISLALAAGAKCAYSCDVLEDRVAHSKLRFADKNDIVSITCSNSPKWLRELLPTLPAGFLVVMLDAHSPSCGPLLEELQAIKTSGIVPDVLLIDDWRYLRINYWGFSDRVTLDCIKSIYGTGMEYSWQDGDGLMVDVLNGPAVNDVLEVRRVDHE